MLELGQVGVGIAGIHEACASLSFIKDFKNTSKGVPGLQEGNWEFYQRHPTGSSEIYFSADMYSCICTYYYAVLLKVVESTVLQYSTAQLSGKFLAFSVHFFSHLRCLCLEFKLACNTNQEIAAGTLHSGFIV